MPCPRCNADTPSWCADCERSYDAWSRQHATDILWQAGAGALFAMIVGLGGPLLGLSPIVGIAGFIAGAATMFTLRKVNNRRRRQQYLTASVPRALLVEGRPGGGAARARPS